MLLHRVFGYMGKLAAEARLSVKLCIQDFNIKTEASQTRSRGSSFNLCKVV